MKRLLSPFEYLLFLTVFYFQLLTRTAAFSNDNISINKNAIKDSQGFNSARFSNVYVQIGLKYFSSPEQVIGSMHFLHGKNLLYLFAERAFK